jgi:hypothetical protein
LPDSAVPQPDLPPSRLRPATTGWRPDPHLIMAYRRTSYVVTDPAAPMVLKVRSINQTASELLQARGLKSALFISAHNPWGTCLSAEDNRRRHAELLQALQPWPLFEGFGASPTGDWPVETSVLVLCDDPDLQAEWLQRFEQNAAVRVSDQGEVELVFNRRRPIRLPETVTRPNPKPWPPSRNSRPTSGCASTRAAATGCCGR